MAEIAKGRVMDPTTEELSEVKANLKKERRQVMIRRILSNKMAVTGSIIILISVVISLLSPLLVSYTPFEMNPANRLQLQVQIIILEQIRLEEMYLPVLYMVSKRQC
ncbi:hypothetical protein JCM9140_3731 [Halalkalibacter wakoensis JCM 9140]|uniref:Oligopeptide transport permease C-like N-terminal domain-containing protein n=1 Tax=Halalkalibacter wakoensis JCM 9140 TaxID=1236970 RepID=W4Q7B0_9BACI|nr:hypothetical protein JCM9140_3731 [Halalkalibacter wakoensis JCM 9140]